jgi:hypothetical protein
MRKHRTSKLKCKQRTTKKYRTRPSPPYSARECPYKSKTGNDHNKYVSKPSVTGVFRWVKENR